jgi:hypothetical protein
MSAAALGKEASDINRGKKRAAGNRQEKNGGEAKIMHAVGWKKGGGGECEKHHQPSPMRP